MDIAADVVSEATLHAQTAGQNAAAGFKDFGGEFLKQLFGWDKNNSDISEEDLKGMNDKDKTASDAAYAQTRAQVIGMYETYRQKRLKEEEERREREMLEAQQHMRRLRGETIQSQQQKQMDVLTATGKASAEKGKSYGAE